MTQEQRTEHKDKMAKVLKEWLTLNLGYPNCANSDILVRLPDMWQVLLTNNLVLEGMTYDEFQHHAHSQYLFADFQLHMTF